MVQYVDNGMIPAGWYYCKDGGYYGDGTKENAEDIMETMEEYLY